MSEDSIISFVEQQDWLAPVQEQGEALVKNAFQAAGEQGQSIKNALHGVWLGHPLHPAITDVPVGSWTAALVLDLLDMSGKKEYGPGADAAIAVGLAGALGAAASGLADWSDTHGKPQRVGALHGLLNVGAAALYGTSWLLRRNGSRGAARAFSFLGYGLVSAGAYLGGALSYNQRIGVDHSPESLPEEFTNVCAESDLLERQPKKVDANGTAIVLFKQNGNIFAIADQCSHLGGPLSEGNFEGDTVVCPWHGSRFCLKTGKVIDGPATSPEPVLDVKISDGQIMVRSRATAQ